MRLNQVTVGCTDVARSERFYLSLGLKLIVKDDHYLRFECPAGESTFSVELVDSVPPSEQVTVYFECEDLDDEYERLRSAGVEFDQPPTDMPWLWREARLRDPDGHRLCLFHAGKDRRHPPWRLKDRSSWPCRSQSPWREASRSVPEVTTAVTLEWRDDIALITIDDGKANALSPDVIAALNEALDQIQAGERASRAVVICGRKGVFSGGFDLEVMRSGDLEAIGALVTSGGELVARLLGSPRPIVCACTGHAIAAGALLALGCHFRVGGDGDYRLGLTETAIGLVLPDWAVVIAEERLSRTELQRATVEARIYSPAEAKDAGFLDVVVPPDQVLDVALEEAKRLAALDPGAYSGTLAKLRGPCLDRLNAAVASGR